MGRKARDSAQPEMHRQESLAGHGHPAGRGRAEAGAQHGLPRGLVEAMARRLKNVDGRNLPGRVQGNPEQHRPLLAQTPGLAGVLGHGHAHDARPAGGAEIEQPSLTPAVAQAAMDTGVARQPITDMDAYRASLRERIAKSRQRLDAFVKTYPQIF